MDEQQLTDAIEAECGSVDRAFRLMFLYQQAVMDASGNRYTLRKLPTADERFRRKAAQEGYSDEAVRLFLSQS